MSTATETRHAQGQQHDLSTRVKSTRGSGWRLVVLASAAFLCCGLAWIIALAPFTGIDEFDHAFRADSVAQGHWQPGSDPLPARLGRGDLIPVRADLATSAAPACLNLPYPGTYNCSPYATRPGGNVLIASAAARYDPVFYVIAGTLAKPFHGDAELYAMRVAGLLMCVGLFALSLCSLLLTSRTRWPLIGLLVGVLPTTVYSVAVAAPNGTQMMAGLAVWTGDMALIRHPDRPRWLHPATALAASLLVTTHTLGCLWLGLICIGLAIHTGFRELLRALRPHTRAEIGGLALLIGSIAFEITWVLLARTNSPGSDSTPPGVHLFPALANGLILWPLQAIAAYPMRNEPAPTTVYAISLVIIVALGVLALRSAIRHRATRRSLLFVVAVSVLFPTVSTIVTYRAAGFAWQGRYGMPFSVGLFVLLGLALDRQFRTHHPQRLVLGALPALWVAAQVVGATVTGVDQRRPGYFVVRNLWHAPSLSITLALGALALLAAVGLCRQLASDDTAVLPGTEPAS